MPFVFSHSTPTNIQNSANSVQPSLQNEKMHETSNTRHDLLNRSGRAQLAPFDSEFEGEQNFFHFSYFPDSILNAKRANPKIRVLEHFLHGNLKPDRFSVSGYGADKPMYGNDTEENRAKNRRVEILIKTAKAVGRYIQ